MADVIRMLSSCKRTLVHGVVILCAVTHAACGYGQEPARPQPAPGSFEIVQGRIAIDGVDEALAGAHVAATFFTSIGERPILGRFFIDGEYREAATAVVILHQALWKDRFSARPDMIGRTVQLDGRAVTVIGVTQPNFNAPDRARFFVPRGTGS